MPSDFRTGLGKKAPVPAKQKRSLYFAFALLPDLVQNIFQNQHCILLVKRMLLLQFIRHHIDSVRIIQNIYFCLIFKQNGVLFPSSFCPIYLFFYFLAYFVDGFLNFLNVDVKSTGSSKDTL